MTLWLALTKLTPFSQEEKSCWRNQEMAVFLNGSQFSLLVTTISVLVPQDRQKFLNEVKEGPHFLSFWHRKPLHALVSSRGFSFTCQILSCHINPGELLALVQFSYLAVSTYLNCSSLFPGNTEEKPVSSLGLCPWSEGRPFHRKLA